MDQLFVQSKLSYTTVDNFLSFQIHIELARNSCNIFNKHLCVYVCVCDDSH